MSWGSSSCARYGRCIAENGTEGEAWRTSAHLSVLRAGEPRQALPITFRDHRSVPENGAGVARSDQKNCRRVDRFQHLSSLAIDRPFCAIYGSEKALVAPASAELLPQQ